MKILVTVKTNKGAGWALRQTEWILRHTDEFEFVIAMPDDHSGHAAEYKELGCRVIPLNMSLPVTRPWRYFSLKKQIRRVVEEEKPDVIHSHFVTTTLMLRLALHKSPVKRIFQVPGPLHLENFFFRWLDKITISKQDYLVGSCQWTTDQYKKMGVPAERCFLNYYGNNEDVPVETGTVLHDQFNLPADTPIVGMVSYFYAPKYYLLQFVGIKGHEDFIRAISLVRREFPNARGVIVGNAWDKKAEKYEKKVHALAEKLCPGGIIFTGYRNDVRNIYHEFSVAVHPSHSENLGGAAPSLVQEVPTVSTNVGGFPDVVIDGETGWTVPPQSPEKLAEKIVWMLKNPDEAKTMARRGRKNCQDLLCIDNTAAGLTDIYRSVAGGER